MDEQIQVEGEVTIIEETEAAILDAAFLKLEITTFKKELLSLLKSREKELSQLKIQRQRLKWAR